MIRLKHFILLLVIIGGVCGYQDIYAQVQNASCSSKKRDIIDTSSDSYKILYSITDDILLKYIQKNYSDFDLNTTISGDPLWYDNKKGTCNNLGLFVKDKYTIEVVKRNSFWSTYASVKNISNSANLEKSTVTSMQNYIKDHCGFNMGVDGQLGKKTINSINICKPPASGKLPWSEFINLINANALYTDIKGTNTIYTGSKFVEGFTPNTIYVDLSKSSGIVTKDNVSSKGLIPTEKKADACTTLFGNIDVPKSDVKDEGGKCCYQSASPLPSLDSSRVIEGIFAVYTAPVQGAGPKLPSVRVSICSISVTTPGVCRFDPPKEESNLKVYNTFKSNTEYISPIDCKEGCPPNSKEIKKGGASLCEKCDIKKCNCGIKLNTDIPFIGRCIVNQKTNNTGQKDGGTVVNNLTAFPQLMGALVKILMSLIMIISFASLIVGGFMMTLPDQYETGKGIIKKVMRTIISLGSLGTILYLVNPNFFS